MQLKFSTKLWNVFFLSNWNANYISVQLDQSVPTPALWTLPSLSFRVASLTLSAPSLFNISGPVVSAITNQVWREPKYLIHLSQVRRSPIQSYCSPRSWCRPHCRPGRGERCRHGGQGRAPSRAPRRRWTKSWNRIRRREWAVTSCWSGGVLALRIYLLQKLAN